MNFWVFLLFEFGHMLIFLFFSVWQLEFWVLLQLKFLSFFCCWVFEFFHLLSFWVWSIFKFLIFFCYLWFVFNRPGPNGAQFWHRDAHFLLHYAHIWHHDANFGPMMHIFGTMTHIFWTLMHIFGTMTHIFGTMTHIFLTMRHLFSTMTHLFGILETLKKNVWQIFNCFFNVDPIDHFWLYIIHLREGWLLTIWGIFCVWIYWECTV